jgi:acetate kinase
MVRPTGSRLSGTTSDGKALVINCGSSSVKFALFSSDGAPSLLWPRALERIGLRNGRFHVVHADGATALEDSRDVPDHDAALALLLDATERHASGARVAAVGHRVVHRGPECDCPAVVTKAFEDRLRELVPLAPLHQPHNLAGIAADRKARPKVVQIAYFGTAFHHWLPRLARLTVLPRTFYDAGIRRYGFRGLSYEYILGALREENKSVSHERVIVAHLGNGASLCALRNGRSVETTMGFSTLAGLSMGTRCGDLDSGIVLYLLAKKNMPFDRVQNPFYKESGLLGLSGLSGNMQDLLAQPKHPGAIEAIEFFCYEAVRRIGALTAVLGGLDRLVFTGGIGATSPAIRARICAALDYLGVVLDPLRSSQGDRIISAEASLVDVQRTKNS